MSPHRSSAALHGAVSAASGYLQRRPVDQPGHATHLTAQLGGFAQRSRWTLADIYTEQLDTPLVTSPAQMVYDQRDERPAHWGNSTITRTPVHRLAHQRRTATTTPAPHSPRPATHGESTRDPG